MRSQYPLQYFLDRVPADATVAELEQFIAYNFRFKLATTYAVQIYVCTALMCTLVLIGIFITTQRILTKTFWLFRLHETRGRRLVVCNATVLFVNVAGVFAALLIAITWSNLLFSRGDASNTTGRWLSYGSGILFLPLLGCAWCCAFGVLYACPGVIESDSIFQAGQKSRKPSATFLNTLFFGAPLAVTLLIAGLNIKAGRLTGQAFDLWEAWTGAMATLDASGPAPPQMVTIAAMIWHQNALGVWWLVLTFCIWAGIAGIFTILFGGISLYLLNMMKNHLREHDQLTRSGARYNLSHTTSYRGVFYPSVDVSHGVIWTATNANATANALAPAYKIIIALCGFVMLGVVSFFVVAVYHASVALEQLGESPEAYGVFVSKILLCAFWISIVAGGGAFFAITGKLLQPLIDGYITRRQIIQSAHANERRKRLGRQRSPMSRLREWIGIDSSRSVGSSTRARARTDSTNSIEFAQRPGTNDKREQLQRKASGDTDIGSVEDPQSPKQVRGFFGEGFDSDNIHVGRGRTLGASVGSNIDVSGRQRSSRSLDGDRTLRNPSQEASLHDREAYGPSTVTVVEHDHTPTTERGWTYDHPVLTVERVVHFSDARQIPQLVIHDAASSYPVSIASTTD